MLPVKSTPDAVKPVTGVLTVTVETDRARVRRVGFAGCLAATTGHGLEFDRADVHRRRRSREARAALVGGHAGVDQVVRPGVDSGLPYAGCMVSVGPPLVVSGPRTGRCDGRLPPLVTSRSTRGGCRCGPEFDLDRDVPAAEEIRGRGVVVARHDRYEVSIKPRRRWETWRCHRPPG